MADSTDDVPPIPPAPEGGAIPPIEPVPVAAAPAAPPPAPLPPIAAPPVAPPAPSGAPAYAPVPAGPPQGLALAAMITGIGSVLLSFGGIGLLPAIAAVVLGHLAQRRQPYARGLWITGLITGYVALGISLIWGLFVVLAIIAGIASSYSY